MVAVLTVATCQFPVSGEIGANLRQIRTQMTASARRGARVAHFPEGALSGYAGTDFATFDGFDWDQLDRATDAIREHARRLGIWTVLGSAHRFSDVSKPHNSLYVISDTGQFVRRADLLRLPFS
jgi:deaminated glutathione amidase